MNDVYTDQTDHVKHALRSGLIIGIINAILVMLIYILDPTLFGSMWYGFVFITLNFILVVVFGIKYRNEIGGYLSFGPAYIHGFITFVVVGLINVLFTLLLFHVINPELPEIIKKATIENMVSMLSSLGLGEDQIDVQIEQLEESFTQEFQPVTMILGFAGRIIIYAIAALITGAIVKKSEPLDNL